MPPGRSAGYSGDSSISKRTCYRSKLPGVHLVNWGNTGYGADSSAIQEQLKNMQQIQASNRAVAAILGDGSVILHRVVAAVPYRSSWMQKIPTLHLIQVLTGSSFRVP